MFFCGIKKEEKSDLPLVQKKIREAFKKKKNSQIWDIVQKIETPPPTPPTLDVLSLDILR